MTDSSEKANSKKRSTRKGASKAKAPAEDVTEAPAEDVTEAPAISPAKRTYLAAGKCVTTKRGIRRGGDPINVADLSGGKAAFDNLFNLGFIVEK